MHSVHQVLVEEGERHKRLTKAVEKVKAVVASPPFPTAAPNVVSLPAPAPVSVSQEESGGIKLAVSTPAPTQSPPPLPKLHLKRAMETDGPAPKRQKV